MGRNIKPWLLILLGVLIIVFLLYSNQKPSINSFEDCVNAGNPIMESFPRKCSANGVIYIEDVMRNLCSPESRNVDVCIEVYQPVCGWNNPEIQCFTYPCASTYSNSCFACSNENVMYYTDGECPK